MECGMKEIFFTSWGLEFRLELIPSYIFCYTVVITTIVSRQSNSFPIMNTKDGDEGIGM